MATEQMEFFFCAESEIEERLRLLIEHQRLTLREAGEEMGYSAAHIFRLVNKFGIERPRRHRAKFHRDLIYQMRMAGVPYREIASRIGCAVRTVQSIAKDYERHQIAADFGTGDDGPFTRSAWGEDADCVDEPLAVKPYRCPVHGLVRLRPCVACMAEGNIGA